MKLFTVELLRLQLKEVANWLATMAHVSVMAKPGGPVPHHGSWTPIGGAAERLRRALDPCEGLRRAAVRAGMPSPLPRILETGVWATSASLVLECGTQLKSIKFTKGRRWRRMAAGRGHQPWPPLIRLRQRRPRPTPGTPANVLAQPMGSIG